MPALHFDALHVLDDVRQFIRDEHAEQRRQFAERIARPLEERVESGTCLTGLTFLKVDSLGRAKFRHGGNDARLREGDAVRLSHPEAESGWDAFIYRDEAEEIWLAREGGFRAVPFHAVREGWLMDESLVDLENLYLEMLDRLPGTEIGQERILPLLLGDAEAAFDEDEYGAVQGELDAGAQRWEDAQREAIAGCLAADHCYLVQGPPGTGKTRVLAQVVARLVERGERVLVTGFTHRAIDNALEASAREIGDHERVARFGFMTHQRSHLYSTFEAFADSPLAEATGGWVAGATPFALRRRLPGVEFDCIVIDEAGQMTTALALMAMMAGRKYLLFGDEHQLGPVVVSRSRRESRLVGIFHALRGQEIAGTRLDVTYRLNDALAHWPSEQFYQGNLVPADGIGRRRLAWSRASDTKAWVADALDPQSPRVWIQFAPSHSRTSNALEREAVFELLTALVEGGIRREEIAVVTPYRRQARKLRRLLESQGKGSWRECVIDTVERMQGQEREVIVLSFCAADAGFIERQFDFLFDPRRLNVSVTRARTKLIILASESLLHLDREDPEEREEADLFDSLFQASTVIPAPESP